MTLLLVIAAVQVFLVDRIPEMTETTVTAALEQWEAVGPASYDLDVTIGGAQPGVVHVEVRNGAVTVATRDGLATPEWTKGEWAVPGQFEMLERELEFAKDPEGTMQAPPGAQIWPRCEFDPKLGYPRRYHRFVTGGAPEVFWTTTLTEQK